MRNHPNISNKMLLCRYCLRRKPQRQARDSAIVGLLDIWKCICIGDVNFEFHNNFVYTSILSPSVKKPQFNNFGSRTLRSHFNNYRTVLADLSSSSSVTFENSATILFEFQPVGHSPSTTIQAIIFYPCNC